MSGQAKAQAKVLELWVARLVTLSGALWEAQMVALWVRWSVPALAGPRVRQSATSTVVAWVAWWERPLATSMDCLESQLVRASVRLLGLGSVRLPALVSVLVSVLLGSAQLSGLESAQAARLELADARARTSVEATAQVMAHARAVVFAMSLTQALDVTSAMVSGERRRWRW